MENYKCPVVPISEEVIEDTEKLTRSLRKLTKALIDCEMCQQINCPLQAQIAANIKKALQEASKEWAIYA
jgi:hypothetical protein